MIINILWTIVFTAIFNLCEGLTGSIPLSDSVVTSLVTGANGYVGKAVVHELIRRTNKQHIVCLVRTSKVNGEQVYWNNVLKALQDYETIIRVMPYDMVDGGSSLELSLNTTSEFRQRRVYHIASVFGPTEAHEQTALDNVKGTEDLVRTIANAGNCKLILTSSMAAVRGTGQSPMNGIYYTQHDWNTQSILGASWGESYQWSKAQSEKRAWELTKELNVPMVSLCPSFVFGPPYGNSDSYSVKLVEQWLFGKGPVQSRLSVDVRDCAIAHVNAGNCDSVLGKRFILSTDERTPSEVLALWLKNACMLSGKGDASKIYFDATFSGGGIPIGEKEVDATLRLQTDLGVELQSAKVTIEDMASKLLQKNCTL
jgi:nucleoside-diphosphate-sugar epimerase